MSDLPHPLYFRGTVKGATKSQGDGSASEGIVIQTQGPEFGP